MVVGSSAAAPGATRTGAAAPEAAAPRAFLAGAAVLYTARFGIKKSQSKSTRSMNIRPKITRGRRNLRWGAAAPPCRAGERPRLTATPGAPREEGSGGAGRARQACVRRRGVLAAVAAATRGAAAPGCGRAWGRPRRGTVPGLSWKPRRHRGKGGRGRRRRCGREREPASPGRGARPHLEAAPPPRERREREEARMRTRERARVWTQYIFGCGVAREETGAPFIRNPRSENNFATVDTVCVRLGHTLYSL